MTKTVKRVKPYRANWRYGIVNHLGGIWTPETFDTALTADRYICAQASANPTWKLSRHKVVPVRVTVSLRRGDQSFPTETK